MLRGSCHCGGVQFHIHNQTELQDLARCNCSLCRRKGAIMASAAIEDFQLINGAELLSLYQWNTGVAKHYFCSVCGIYTHHQRRRRPQEIGFNIACIEGIDPASFEPVPMIDGASFSIVNPPE